MNKPEANKKKRPIAITIICLEDFIIYPIGIYFLSTPMLKEFFTRHNTPAWVLPFLNLWAIAYLIVMVGLWRMKKWAAYIYILLTVNALATNELSTRSLIIQTAIVYCIAKNIPKMS